MLCKTITIFALLLLSTVAPAQDRPAYELSVTGAPDHTLKLNTADFAKMPRTMISATEHGKEHKYEGVLLHELLKEAGAPLGDKLKGQNMGAFVYCSAKDGYHVVLALAEVEPAFQENQILIADMMDGKPLSAEQGPLRLVVPEDKKPARWIRMLQSVEVRLPEAK